MFVRTFKYLIINRSLIVVLVSDDNIYPEALSRRTHTTGLLKGLLRTIILNITKFCGGEGG